MSSVFLHLTHRLGSRIIDMASFDGSQVVGIVHGCRRTTFQCETLRQIVDIGLQAQRRGLYEHHIVERHLIGQVSTVHVDDNGGLAIGTNYFFRRFGWAGEAHHTKEDEPVEDFRIIHG